MNAVIEAFRDRANDLNMRQTHIDEVATRWNSIYSLSESEGFQELVELMKARVESIRAQIVDGAVEDVSLARGEMKSLQWLINSPSLASVHLMAATQAQEALNADKEEFIHGA